MSDECPGCVALRDSHRMEIERTWTLLEREQAENRRLNDLLRKVADPDRESPMHQMQREAEDDEDPPVPGAVPISTMYKRLSAINAPDFGIAPGALDIVYNGRNESEEEPGDTSG